MEQNNSKLEQLRRLISVGNINAARMLWQELRETSDAQAIYQQILSEFGIALD